MSYYITKTSSTSLETHFTNYQPLGHSTWRNYTHATEPKEFIDECTIFDSHGGSASCFSHYSTSPKSKRKAEIEINR
jgi:hypothetical protein